MARRTLIRRHQWRPATAFDTLMRSSAPVVWYRMNEASGTTILNYGSLASANGTLSGSATLGAAGLRVRRGITFDGLTTSIGNTAIGTVGQQTAFTYMGLVRANSAGETNAGRIVAMLDNTGATFIRHFYIASANLNLSSVVVAGTNATTTTNNNAIALNTWYTLFATYDDAGDRKIRIYIGRNGLLKEASYATQTAATGTLATYATARLYYGGVNGVVTFDGIYDEGANWGRVLSVAEMTRLTRAAGV